MRRLTPSGLAAPEPRRRPTAGEAGFTLVEVLLALVLLATLLTAMNQFVFSITEVWTKHRDEFIFVQHTRAVARHLDEMLQTAANSSHASTPSGGAPAVEEIRLPEGGTDELVTFDLPEGDRLLVWPGRPLPEVQCALGWRKDVGLVIYWKSRLETDFADTPPRMAIVSGFVTALGYDYYDKANDTWTTEEELQRDESGNYELPRRLRLHFQRKGRDYEEVIEVPAITEGLPAY